MNGIIGLLALVSCFAAPGIRGQDPLAAWEQRVFLDVAERWHEYLHVRKDGASQEEMDSIRRQVGATHRIDAAEVKRIENKALDIEPNDREYDIYIELWGRLNALGPGGTVEQSKRIHHEVATEYGLSPQRLYAIEYVVMEGFWL